MRIGCDGGTHLGYCTNIHPGESWPQVRENLARYLPAVKARVSPDRPFGVGLRLSAIAAQSLAADPGELDGLRRFLSDHDLYVFTLNGFPYGTFHGSPVKERAYLPDWRSEERLRYTNRLADLLAALLTADAGFEGSISTVPGGFGPDIRTADDVDRIAVTLVQHVAHLVRLRESTGCTITLALEPEPCCFLETIEQTAAFFTTHLHGPEAARALSALVGCSRHEAEAALRRHLGVCLDVCHAAVEFEQPAAGVARLRDAGVGIAKMQLSAGLRLEDVDLRRARQLEAFDDGVYLHQVVERSGARLTRYGDLHEAFAGLGAAPAEREWRVHFHVPIFLDDLGAFSSTQDFLREILAQQKQTPISRHLEVETYTWDVLPAAYRCGDITTAITRELEWVRRQLEH